MKYTIEISDDEMDRIVAERMKKLWNDLKNDMLQIESKDPNDLEEYEKEDYKDYSETQKSALELYIYFSGDWNCENLHK